MGQKFGALMNTFKVKTLVDSWVVVFFPRRTKHTDDAATTNKCELCRQSREGPQALVVLVYIYVATQTEGLSILSPRGDGSSTHLRCLATGDLCVTPTVSTLPASPPRQMSASSAVWHTWQPRSSCWSDTGSSPKDREERG